MVLDAVRGTASDAAARAVQNQLRTLYRARPFTKAVPFNNILGADPIPLWLPQNAYFEVAKIFVRASIAAVDLVFADTQAQQPIAFIMPPTGSYQGYDIDPGYRSLLYNNAQLLVWDPSNSGVQIKGVIYGWEVTPDGYYR